MKYKHVQNMESFLKNIKENILSDIQELIKGTEEEGNWFYEELKGRDIETVAGVHDWIKEKYPKTAKRKDLGKGIK